MTMPTPKIPEYFKDLPDKALISTSEIVKIFGYRFSGSITNLIKLHGFPKPIASITSNRCLNKKPGVIFSRNYWHKSTVEKYIKDLNNAGK